MSQWAKVKVIIKNEQLFKEACKKHQISYTLNNAPTMQMQGLPVHAVLKDEVGSPSRHSEAYLCAAKNGGYQLSIDNDPSWCSITARLGKNGGLLMRSYTESMTRGLISRAGGMVQSATEQKDKSLLLKVMVP